MKVGIILETKEVDIGLVMEASVRGNDGIVEKFESMSKIANTVEGEHHGIVILSNLYPMDEVAEWLAFTKSVRAVHDAINDAKTKIFALSLAKTATGK